MNDRPQDRNGERTGLRAGEVVLALLMVLSGLGFLVWSVVCAGLCPIPR